TVVILQKFYLIVNELALSLGYSTDSPSNLKKVTETV
ncbi:SIS domain-containing protein, partial [Francisella tularensis subsp. holarctica]|nr:SIS domain-containing protein [Francisella tularensis subsp. holarctica]